LSFDESPEVRTRIPFKPETVLDLFLRTVHELFKAIGG